MIDETEAGRVRPDTKREREYGHGAGAGVPQQLAECEAEVVHKNVTAEAKARWTMTKSMSERLHWIDFGRAARRKIACWQRNSGEDNHHSKQCHGIGWLHFEKECL